MFTMVMLVATLNKFIVNLVYSNEVIRFKVKNLLPFSLSVKSMMDSKNIFSVHFRYKLVTETMEVSFIY